MDNKADTLAHARAFAAAGTDLYELLGVDAATGRDDIHRAWRRKGLRYHPDKAGAQYDAALYERFAHARDVLVDEAARAAYDAARAAAAQRQRQADQMSAERRRFKDELEAAERGGGATGGAPFAPSATTTAPSEYEALREAGRRRAAARLQRAQEAAARARQEADARADAREAALEQRLRDKEDKARRRRAARGEAGPGGRAEDGAAKKAKNDDDDGGGRAAPKKDDGKAAAAWRALLRPQGPGDDKAAAAPIQTQPLYAHTLARLRAAGAAERQRRRQRAAGDDDDGDNDGQAPPPPAFQPEWDAVDDPAVRQYIARVPRWRPGAGAGASTAPMDTAG